MAQSKKRQIDKLSAQKPFQVYQTATSAHPSLFLSLSHAAVFMLSIYPLPEKRHIFFKFALQWVHLKKTSVTFIYTENPKGTVDQITLDVTHSQSEFRHNVMIYHVIFAYFQGEVSVLKHFLLNPSVICRDNYKEVIHRLISEKSEHCECWVEECCDFLFLFAHPYDAANYGRLRVNFQ